MDNKKREIIITMANILIEEIDISNETTSGGIALPDNVDNKNTKIQRLLKGKVIDTGPGFIVPFPHSNSQDSEINRLVGENDPEGSVRPMMLSMDVHPGDIVHYTPNLCEYTLIEGILRRIIPYTAIRVIERDMGN